MADFELERLAGFRAEQVADFIGIRRQQGLDYPFPEIAKQGGVDEKTVRAIFTEYVAELEKDFKRETPAILGLDEIYLSTPRGVITNIGDCCLVDMLDNRRKVTIVEFLRSLSYAEPECVTRQVIREVNFGTDLSTLLAEIDTWPTKG